MTVAPTELLTVDEAAAWLRQSRSTLYRKLRAGELRAVRLGSHPSRPLRVPAAELLRYIAANRASTEN